jgi:amidase
MNALIGLTARDAVARLRTGDVSPLALIDAALDRIAATDGAVNALPTLCAERARDRAKAIMDNPPADPPPWYLHGLPIAVKDLTAVAGVRCTMGSPIHADWVPDTSDILVEMLEANGAVVLAKANTPEFGAGAQTFNDVFGTTTNPFNTSLTPGGSSGGSAAALAAGQVWLATGSDLGGSLRIPASYASVVGLRPSPGRVAHGPSPLPFGLLSVEGPMARTVGDVALMLDAQCGRHPGDPISLERPARTYLSAAESPAVPARVGFSPDLGIAPVDAEVRDLCAAAANMFADLGAEVVAACPDLSDAEEIFRVLRAAQFAAGKAPLLASHRDQLKPEVIWNIEEGLKLTADDIGRAQRGQGAMVHSVAAFFEHHDLLLCPTVVAPPFDHTIRYLTELNGVEFPTYVSWLVLTFAITLVGCPAISVPCGFTADGRPVGLQIVAPIGEEHRLLSAAAAFEDAAGLATATPIDPRSGNGEKETRS